MSDKAKGLEVFISWSGDRSKAIARIVSDWLQMTVSSCISPWFSVQSIDKGARPENEITESLERIDFGVLILTPENLSSEWVLFEAGALSKQATRARVVPLLAGLKKSAVGKPISMFQMVEIDDRDAMLDFAQQLNKAIAEQKLPTLDAARIEAAFARDWEVFSAKIADLLKEGETATEERSQLAILGEVLEIVRAMERRTASPGIGFPWAPDPQVHVPPSGAMGFFEGVSPYVVYGGTTGNRPVKIQYFAPIFPTDGDASSPSSPTEVIAPGADPSDKADDS